jgi:periplasmic protein TonB
MNSNHKKGNAYLEVLFANRNKAYGSYELRTNYARRLRNGLICTLVVASIIILSSIKTDAIDDGGFVKPRGAKPLDTLKVVLKKIEPVKPVIRKISSRSATAHTDVPKQPTLPTTVVPDNEAPVAVAPIKDNTSGSQNPSTIPTGNTGGSPIGAPTGGSGGTPGPTVISPNGGSNGGIAEVGAVDQLPSFPGGENALRLFLNKNLEFPELAREKGVEGDVEINFVVYEDGSIHQIIPNNKDDYGFSTEGIRVIGKMPNWKPAIIAGKPVKCYFSVPINFVLDDNQ